MNNKRIRTATATRLQITLKSIHDEELQEVELPTSYKEYDEEGHLIKEVSWDDSGSLSEKYDYVYANGRKVEEISYLDEEDIAEHHRFEYDGDKIAKAHISYMDGTEEVCNYTYENDLLVKKESIDEDGDEGEKEFFLYEEGQLIRYEKHGDFGEEEVTTQKWDNKKLIERDQRLLLEEDRVLINNEYNNNGLLAKSIEHREVGKSIIENEYHYDEKDQIIMVKQSEGALVQFIKYRYDDNGNEYIWRMCTKTVA